MPLRHSTPRCLPFSITPNAWSALHELQWLAVSSHSQAPPLAPRRAVPTYSPLSRPALGHPLPSVRARVGSRLSPCPAGHAQSARRLCLSATGRQIHGASSPPPLHHQHLKDPLHPAPSTEDFWQRAVPQMAFEGRPYLMDAILSVAALHLRFQHPRDVALARASHAYTASALAEYCASLERGITAHNAEALFLTATLIAFQSTASRIFAKDDAEPNASDAHPTSHYVLPMPWFHAFQGVKTVATSWQWIRHSDIVKAVIDSQPSFQLDLNPLGPDSFFGHLLDGLDDKLANEPPQRVSATSQGYSHAVSVLNWAHKNAHAPAALAFPASVSRRFLEVVEEKRPCALAVLACFFALLKRMENVWLENVARREVTGLVSMLEPGSPWWRHLEWPVRISVWDSNEIPSDVWGAECEGQPQGAGTSPRQ